jgi:hypothetical protein
MYTQARLAASVLGFNNNVSRFARKLLARELGKVRKAFAHLLFSSSHDSAPTPPQPPLRPPFRIYSSLTFSRRPFLCS